MKILTTPSGKKQKGATMVEYAIMVALIAIVSIATITGVGINVNRIFGLVNTAMNSM